MDQHTILQLVEIAFAVAAFSYGIFEHYKRQKVERILRTIMQTYPGDVAKIEQSCNWAWTNIRDAHNAAGDIAESEEKQKALKHINLAYGDAAASYRMCSILFNQLLALQQAQFGTRKIIHPEKNKLSLCQLEAENSN